MRTTKKWSKTLLLGIFGVVFGIGFIGCEKPTDPPNNEVSFVPQINNSVANDTTTLAAILLLAAFGMDDDRGKKIFPALEQMHPEECT
ncbi:hypothetical protein FACS1894190_17240 [Spirochaetia bacterium]|nr:hypothetical protein FACS1894190_17240 [Spirochaetia bacterium]